LLLVLLPLGCGSSDQATPAPSASAVVDQGADPLLDGKLADALKSVNKPGMAPPAASNQPPPHGVFEPGMADKAFAPNAAPTITVLDDGKDPKLQLLANLPEVEKLTMTIVVASQGNPPIPLVFDMLIGDADKVAAAGKPKAAAPTAPKEASSADAAAAPPPAANANHAMAALVQNVSVAGIGKEELPKKILDQFESLKGVTLSFTATPAGLTNFSHVMPKGSEEAKGGFDMHIDGLEEALSAMYTPGPDRPVGEGAYWMLTDRRTSFGSDVIRYRVFTVKQVDGDHALVSIQVSQYAASDARPTIVAVQGSDAVSMAAYQAQGQGGLELVPGSRWGKQGGIKLAVGADLVPTDQKDDPQAPHGKVQFQLAGQIGIMDLSDAGGAPGGPNGGAPGGPNGGAPRRPGGGGGPGPRHAPAPAPQP